MAWLAAQPSLASVITGATKPEQVAANAASVDWKMSDDDVAAVVALLT
jgi:aryl-alcohol dehydrogenase-like predicted oxidoreductase